MKIISVSLGIRENLVENQIPVRCPERKGTEPDSKNPEDTSVPPAKLHPGPGKSDEKEWQRRPSFLFNYKSIQDLKPEPEKEGQRRILFTHSKPIRDFGKAGMLEQSPGNVRNLCKTPGNPMLFLKPGRI